MSRRTEAIVVTYRSAEVVDACVQPLLEAGLSVIVVDNDATAPALERYPEITVIENLVNVGFPAAVNQGLATCVGDVVLLVNPDCVVPPATAHRLIEYLRAHEDVAVVGPRLRETDGSVNLSAHPLSTLVTLLGNRARRSVPGLARILARDDRFSSYDACLHATEPTEVQMMIAACVAVRRSFLEDVGGLDAGYFMYCEDMELCLQAWEHGYRVVYLPDVEAVHAGGGSSGDRSHVWPIHSRSLLRFHALHHPRTVPLVRAALLVRASLGILDPRRKRRAAWTQVARTVIAFRAWSVSP